ncbi:MAG TPA: DUF433 domain-containing protein [Aggregatilineales bacterium]|nr:DUF433 domain-containing protein [Aggregatilineales bacterium]
MSNPEVRGGRPCIAGTSLRVTDVVIAAVIHLRLPDQIAVDYGISLAQVHAALAYYYEHQAESDQDIREPIATSRILKEKHLANGGRSILPG